MIVKDFMKSKLHYYGLRSADAEECMGHVVQELKKDDIFVDFMRSYDVNCWELPIQRFRPQDLDFVFEKFVFQVAFRWLAYRHYDATDE